MTKLNGELLETYNYHKNEVIKIVDRESKEDIAQCTIYTKSYHIKKMGETLEIAGTAKEEISTQLYRDFDGIVSKQLIRTIASMAGWTNRKFERKDYQESREEEVLKNSTLNSSSGGTATVLEFGGDDDSTATPRGNNTQPIDRPTPEEMFEEENRDYLDLLSEYVEFVQKGMISRLKKERFCSELDPKEKDEFIEYAKGALELVKQCWDKRQTIPVNTQMQLTNTVLLTTINHGASNFVAKLKDMAGLTSKQVTKTLKGVVRDIHHIYEPSNTDEAVMNGFSGIQCNCGNWRVKLDGNVAHCFKCENDWHVKPQPLGYTQLQKENLEAVAE